MKYKKSVLWNCISLCVMAFAGLMMNAIVAFFYDASTLGIFNETYAWYVILSQISVCGIHMAVLKFVPEQQSVADKRMVLKSAILITGIISVVITMLAEFLFLFIYNVEWCHTLQIACIGLIFFSLNKVLLNYLNAIYLLTLYALIQCLRYFLFVFILMIISLIGWRYEWLAVTFPLSESFTFFAALFFLWVYDGVKGNISKHYIKKLFLFGIRIFPSNMVLELNTKTDIICLGLLIDDTAKIGVYSFAVLFSEGFYQLFTIIRKFINPKIAELNVRNKLNEYIEQIKVSVHHYLFWGTVVIYIMVLMIYYIISIMIDQEYQIGIIYIAVICFSIGINAEKIIFGDILAQTGHPWEESKMNLVTIGSNAVLNIILILCFGITGAAVATGLSYFIYSAYLRYLIDKKLSIRI